jgi:hypothetical protein
MLGLVLGLHDFINHRAIGGRVVEWDEIGAASTKESRTSTVLATMVGASRPRLSAMEAVADCTKASLFLVGILVPKIVKFRYRGTPVRRSGRICGHFSSTNTIFEAAGRVAASMAAATVAVPTASPAEEDGGGTADTVAASAGRMLSRVLLLALTKWAFPSMRAKGTQESSRCSAEANARKSNHMPEQDYVSPSSAA